MPSNTTWLARRPSGRRSPEPHFIIKIMFYLKLFNQLPLFNHARAEVV
ncbi:MAG: hypothetical protein HY973_02785 [Candidatus Kerfeldbacteria bacterium]|nr:hypothetical protein [Candidatus Kerfeldbacteria bacterium]